MTQLQEKYSTFTKRMIDLEFLECVRLGDLDTVRYLLTSPDLKQHANIKMHSNKAFFLSCKLGHLHILDYLLTSPELTKHCTPNDLMYSIAVLYSVEFHHFNIFTYFLNNPLLKEKINIHIKKDAIFLFAQKHEEKDIFFYLIFDYNIQKTEYIEHIISQEPYISKMFEMRKIKNKLNDSLCSHQKSSHLKI